MADLDYASRDDSGSNTGAPAVSTQDAKDASTADSSPLAGPAPAPVDPLADASDMRTVQGATGPTQVDVSKPDFNQDQTTPDVSHAPNSGSLWQNILMGALTGLAGSARAKTFTQGLSAGVGAEMNQEQVKKENNLQSEQQDNANQNAADIHKAHLANGLLVNMQIAHQWDLMHPDYQKQAIDSMKTYNATLQANGVKPSFTGSEQDAEAQAKQLITSADPSKHFNYRVLPNLSQPGQFDVVEVPADVTAKEVQVQMMGADGKMETKTLPRGTPWAQVDAINSANQKNNMDLGKNKLEKQTDADIDVAKQKQLLPLKLQEEAAKQKIAEGDPAGLAQLLINGDVAPSQVVSSRKPEFASKAFAAAKAADPNWNAQQAEGYFKAAQSQGNVQFFGSANSLVDKDGTLQQLREAHSSLPVTGAPPIINKGINWADKTIGGKAPSGFQATAIGVADDYAKVMGGGMGTDAARQQIMDTLQASLTNGQFDATVENMRKAVLSQEKGRVGTNPVMRKMYGYNLPEEKSTSKPSTGSSGAQVDGVYNPATGKVEKPKGR